MDVNDLITMLTEGLPPEQAAVVRSAIERDSVKAKASGLKQQSEYEQLVQRQQALQQELEGDAATGKLGAKAYREWYDKNYNAVLDLQKRAEAYERKYGTLENPTNQDPTKTTPPNTAPAMTPEQIAAEVDRRIQAGYAPKWSNLLTTTGSILQKHIRAGRKNDVDFDKLGALAAEKFGGDLSLAYDEWDKPERERVAKENEEKEIKRRVDEELQKRGASQQFPSGADLTPGALSGRTKADVDKFDKNALQNDLAREWAQANVS